MRLDVAARHVRAVLGRHVAGYCYVASEAIYHLAGGRRAGLCPMVLRTADNRGQHWFLEHRPGGLRNRAGACRIDVTAGQFRPRLRASEYALASGCEFLTKRPSKGAAAIIWCVKNRAVRRAVVGHFPARA
jgi:hypothetical protein